MRATNRKRALMVSGSVILLCLSLIVGTTYAVFTDKDEFHQHLVAGNLEMKLERTELTKTYLNGDGYLTTVTLTGNDAYADLTDATPENVFGIGNEKVVPMSSYSAKMKITNDPNKSDVAIGYWIQIVNRTANADMDLSDQIIVTVTDANGNVYPAPGQPKASVASGLSIGSESAPIGKLDFDDTAEFTVTILFENLADDVNHAAKGDEIDFDLVVHAFQLTAP